jgi:NSS family neurotransmitter:Na+ symporter
MTVFGSYVDKQRKLFKDAFTVGVLDLSIILFCLLMIFPAAFAFGISPAVGEGLLFLTLPNIFNAMPGTYVWALLFYVGLAFVAFSTAAAVMENITAIGMDKFGWSRQKSALVNFVVLLVLCTPSAFTRNIWAGFVPPTFPHLGAFFTFLTMEIALPIGALLYVLYCTSSRGWGWDNFIKEANEGTEGWTFPLSLRFYMTYVMPAIIIFIFIFGQVQRWILGPMGILI